MTRFCKNLKLGDEKRGYGDKIQLNTTIEPSIISIGLCLTPTKLLLESNFG